MNAVGIFAGRGDVIVAMGLAFVLGAWISWWVRSTIAKWQLRRAEKEEK